jgi:7-cyano-7-deazaguanine synthase
MNYIYGKHWSTSGADVPDTNTTDEAVYLPGRNLMLLTQTAVWCVLNQINHIALGSLGTNPFPDASDKFLLLLQNTLTTGLNFDINILRPYRDMHKQEVILAAKHLPLHLTFSCINPIISSDKGAASIHCGICNKCGERQKAFVEAQIEDLTLYASPLPSHAATIRQYNRNKTI